MVSTYLELNGKFKFSINQNGLDYYNEEEKEQALNDFKEMFEEWVEQNENGYADIDFNYKDIKIEVGE